MHVLIIFLLIVGLVIARIHSPRLEEGLDGETGSTGSTSGSEIPFKQPSLYDGVW